MSIQQIIQSFILTVFAASILSCTKEKDPNSQQPISTPKKSNLAPPIQGGANGGGGFAVVCRNADQKILMAELLDLYEGRIRGLPPRNATGKMEEDYLIGVKRTYALQGYPEILVGAEARENLARFMKLPRFTAPGERLPRLNDIGKTIVHPLPSGCDLEQLAIFYDTTEYNGTIDIDTEIWNSLDSINQAALVSHELFYIYNRILDEKTSENSRYPVSIIYSQNGGVLVQDGVQETDMSCMTSDSADSENWKRSSRFFIAKSPNGVTLQFTQIMGRFIISKATALLEGISWKVRTTVTESGDRLQTTVAEANVNRQYRVPINTLQREDWEVAVDYVTGKKIRVGLYQDGVLIEEAFVQNCFQKL